MALYDDIIATGLPLGEHGLIAETLSNGRTKIIPRFIGIGTIMDTLGPVNGAALLDAMDALKATNNVIKWAWVLLESGTLDMGSQATRAELDGLVTANTIPQAAADALKALAVVPDPVTWQQVAAAIEEHG